LFAVARKTEKEKKEHKKIDNKKTAAFSLLSELIYFFHTNHTVFRSFVIMYPVL